MITRRTTLAGLALLSLSPVARAEPGDDALTRHAAEASGKRPAVILLHGEADQNVSIANGRKLIELARSVGAEAEFVPYPGKPHGFDFSDTDPMAADAIDRVSRFFQARLADLGR
ncbi:alpha/beta hydrolase family protein [Bradyrhizobium iriomotense]|uniref:Peptidase S9 prolyl oligopeptidase catalytic domain-containing protein n=1 Tax=Bradyrhizobium iriomotense TaxID=441950 RepID=A0ABQ6AN60_9BRAD|nr:prolyl oligopeptidase family serine peptidase [Bradyrhizobium iriomotense]GLR83330.1 hypothetical protein GCM10007857_00400 [Bradyrhizobium iriomotense]